MEVHQLSALELWERLERREISSVEIVTALQKRSSKINASVNAYVHEFRAQALAEARAADEARERGESHGPLHGLPISVKESIDTAGVASTLGIQRNATRLAADDAVAVRLARSAGAIVLGKTNVPQTLLSPMETMNAVWGITRNPWNLERAPGGSSGGESAAIASGLSVLGIGTDIGGSIRIPSAYCGICGIKPTVSRWSNFGSNTAIAGQEVIEAQIGPMARTTADLGLFLRALDTPLHTPFDPNVPPLPIGDEKNVNVRSLRIGFYEDDGFFTPARSMQRAVREAARMLEAQGAEVIEYRPSNAEEMTYLYFAALSSDGGASVDAQLGNEDIIPPLKTLRRVVHLPNAGRRALSYSFGLAREDRLSKLLGVLGRKSVFDLWKLTARRTALQREEHAAWNRLGLDAVLCPVHVTPAPPHGASQDFTIGFCYVARYNTLNMPAGCVPVTRVRSDETERPLQGPRPDRLEQRAAQIEAHSAGLPVGVQVIARPWREDVALAVMGAIETAARKNKDFPTTPVS